MHVGLIKYMKKKYKKPGINNIIIDKEISLILMTYTNGDDPPPPPPGGPGAAAANPFQENAFDKPLE